MHTVFTAHSEDCCCHYTLTTLLTCRHGIPNSISHSPPEGKQKYQDETWHTRPELQEEVEGEVDDKGCQSQEEPWDICHHLSIQEACSGTEEA